MKTHIAAIVLVLTSASAFAGSARIFAGRYFAPVQMKSFSGELGPYYQFRVRVKGNGKVAGFAEEEIDLGQTVRYRIRGKVSAVTVQAGTGRCKIKFRTSNGVRFKGTGLGSSFDGKASKGSYSDEVSLSKF